MTSRTPQSLPTSSGQDELKLLEQDLAKSFEEWLRTDGGNVTTVAPKLAAQYFRTRVEVILAQHTKEAVEAAEAKARIDELTLFAIALARSNGNSDADKVHAVQRYFADRLAKLAALASEKKEGGDESRL